MESPDLGTTPRPTKPRLPLISDIEPDTELAQILATAMTRNGTPMNIFRMLGHHPKLLKLLNLMGGFLLNKGLLPARERELVILRVGWTCRAISGSPGAQSSQDGGRRVLKLRRTSQRFTRRHADRWDRQARDYDTRTAGLERRFLAASRHWMGRRARGATLEIAIGTGANLPYYSDDVTVTGIDLSGGMLTEAARRISKTEPGVALVRADAALLPFPAESFDTVVATFALCGVPDVETTLVEALRVLRPGGRLLLADHVAGHWPLRLLQYAVDLITVPLHGEHFTRRPLKVLHRLAAEDAVTIEETERHGFGIIERVQATTPHS